MWPTSSSFHFRSSWLRPHADRRADPATLEVAAHQAGTAIEGAALDKPASENEITCVYFFSAEPAELAGGEMRLRRGENVHVVEPRNNAMLIYPTSALECIMPLRCPDAFGKRRFTATARIA